MSESVVQSHRSRWRMFSGIRGLLIALVLVALGLGWLAQAERIARRQSLLISELKDLRVYSRLDEPTGLTLIVKKFAPGSETKIRDRIGPGWFDRPTIFFGWGFVDGQVEGVTARLRQLGTVREVHYEDVGLTQAGLIRLREGLPGVNVVPNAKPSLHHYFLGTQGTHYAYPAAIFAAVVALVLLTTLIVLGRWFFHRIGAIRRSWVSPT